MQSSFFKVGVVGVVSVVLNGCGSDSGPTTSSTQATSTTTTTSTMTTTTSTLVPSPVPMPVPSPAPVPVPAPVPSPVPVPVPVPSPAPVPVPPPTPVVPTPVPPPPSGPVVDAINNRFLLAKPSNDLAEVGVVIHTFDNLDDPNEPWRPCDGSAGTEWCAKYSDRSSTSVIGAWTTKQKDGTIGIFDSTRGGFIYAPAYTEVFCSYVGDGGSMAPDKACQNGEDDCLPGCGFSHWCNETSDWGTCAFRKGNLSEMVKHDMSSVYPYNEIVVSGKVRVDNLPHSVEAIFYPKTTNCTAGSPCLMEVQKMQKDMIAKFGLTPNEIPLLELDLSNWQLPFMDVSPDGMISNSLIV